MAKTHNNEAGFSAVEAALVIVIVILIGAAGWLVYRNHHKTTTTTKATSTSTSTQTAKTHTAQEATTFVQKTYDDYLTAINNAPANNTQPLGLVGLAAVKDSLTTDFYTKAAASKNGSDFSCAAEFAPNKYTASLSSSSTGSATIALAIATSTDGTTRTTGMTATVDLSTLKITAVTCPN